MIISKTRSYTINMGDYNQFKFSASVTVDTEQENLSEVEALDYANGFLVECLKDELEQSKIAPNQSRALQTLIAK